MASPAPMDILLREACSDVPVVIDASNVAGDVSIGGCGKFCWSRVEQLQQAWKREIDSNTRFLIVVDESLAPRLSSHCKLKYRAASESKDFAALRFADPEVLHLAEVHDALVLTLDVFRDHRRTHPWLDGCLTRFVGWKSTGSSLTFTFRDMGIPSDFSKTYAEEVAEFKGRGLTITSPEVRQALGHAYRCDNGKCWVHRYDPGRFTGVPDFSVISKPKCPSCGELLVDLGMAPRLVQVKFSNLDNSCLERRTLSPGDSLEIGRDSIKDLLQSVLHDDWLAISRRHARIDWDGESLTCSDLGSRNGTKKIPWEGKARGYGNSVNVSMSPMLLLPRDEVRIGRVLRVTRSARQFVLDVGSNLTKKQESGIGPVSIPSEKTLRGPVNLSENLRVPNHRKSNQRQ